MANVVAKVMLKMKLVQTDKVVFVNNALELLAQYAGQTPVKVDKKVNLSCSISVQSHSFHLRFARSRKRKAVCCLSMRPIQ